MRNAYISALYDLAQSDQNILSLVADNGAIVFDRFRVAYPDRFINFGISEANMVSVAAGLAASGKTPFAYTIAGFITMRAFEQVRDDVCLQKQNVKLIGVGGGFAYGTLGPTHHATEDLAVMRVLPEMTILVPASPLEAKKATFAAAEHRGPVYIRLEATKEPEIYEKDYNFQIGHAETLSEGADVTLIATGSIVFDALQVARELQAEGMGVRVLNMHTIKPLDVETVIRAAWETNALLTIEEHSVIGGLGGAVAEALAENNQGHVQFARMGLNDAFAQGYGSHAELRRAHGLSVEGIKAKTRELWERKNNA